MALSVLLAKYNNNIVKFMKDKLLINSNSLKPLVREDINEFIAINNRIKELSEKGKKKIVQNTSLKDKKQDKFTSILDKMLNF